MYAGYLFHEDFVLLDEIYSTKAQIMSESFPKYKLYDNISREVSIMVEMRDGFSIFKIAVSECARNEITDNKTSSAVNPYYSCEDVNLYTYFYHNRRRIVNINYFINSTTLCIQNVIEDYKDLLEYIYGNSLKNYRSVDN